MKCLEDFKNHCRKIHFLYILLFCDEMLWGFQKSLLKNWNKFNSYVFYLWWNDVRTSKVKVEKFWKKKVILLYFFNFVMKWCDEMTPSFCTNDGIHKNLTCMWWNALKISKIIVEKFEKFASYIFYYFVMKCCEDFKNHCWKIEISSILMYFICGEMMWGLQKS